MGASPWCPAQQRAGWTQGHHTTSGGNLETWDESHARRGDTLIHFSSLLTLIMRTHSTDTAAPNSLGWMELRNLLVKFKLRLLINHLSMSQVSHVMLFKVQRCTGPLVSLHHCPTIAQASWPGLHNKDSPPALTWTHDHVPHNQSPM